MSDLSSSSFFTRLRSNFQRVALERHDAASSNSELQDEITRLHQRLEAHRIALAAAEQALLDASTATRAFLKESPSLDGRARMIAIAQRSSDTARLIRAQLAREIA